MLGHVTIKIGEELKTKIIEYYADIKQENSGEYIEFFGKSSNLIVTIYSSKKEGEYKATFLGASALKEAQKFDPNAQFEKKKESTAPTKAVWEILDEQIGSDEVGTGDFFGPICVCAAYIKKSDIKRLKELGVDDSKRLNDDDIKTIGHVLINEFEYSQVSLNNEKFNELVDQNMNMNEMKCKLHNQVLFNLKNKHKNIKNILVDQFTSEQNYYKYIKQEKHVVDKITFKTKGESYFPSVAVGSIIARYSFLQKMEALNKKYGVEIPFGASTKVDEFAKEFVKKFGMEELNKIVKKNFANYKKLTK